MDYVDWESVASFWAAFQQLEMFRVIVVDWSIQQWCCAGYEGRKRISYYCCAASIYLYSCEQGYSISEDGWPIKANIFYTKLLAQVYESDWSAGGKSMN